MIRATFDANVLASGLTQTAQSTSPASVIAYRWLQGDFNLTISDYILEELTIAFGAKYFRTRRTKDEIEEIFSLVRRRAEIVALPGNLSGVAAHRHDDPVLETAVAGKADYLVTGDQELLKLGRYRGVVILTARDFLAVLNASTTLTETR